MQSYDQQYTPDVVLPQFLKKIKENVDLAQPLVLSDIQTKQDPSLRIKTWLKDTLEVAKDHFRGVLDDDDIGEILQELKSEHQAQMSMKYGNNDEMDH